MNSTINIAGHDVGAGHPVYIIAEMSANHGQNLEQARAIVRAAKEAGADAVKLQTYTPDTMTLDVRHEHFQISQGTVWDGRYLYDLYGEAFTPWEWQPKLKQFANELGMDCFSTPFDFSAVEFLERMEMPAHKIASFELVDLSLIRRVAATGKPVIMSTGMASLAEIDAAVHAFRDAGGRQLALLKCTSAYPAPPEEANLATIPHLSAAFGVPVGLSDHTLGVEVPIAAVALGACIIEKHLTLSRRDGGPDATFSLEPSEFKAMTTSVRRAHRAIGAVNYSVTPKEAASRRFRRSLFVSVDMRAGEVFTEANVRSIRPSMGLPPAALPDLLGRRAACNLKRGTPLAWNLVA